MASTPTAAHGVSTGRWFWIAASAAWKHEHLQVLAARTHVTVYGDPGLISTVDSRLLASQFEQKIYPTDLRTFGRPHELGRIAVVLAALDGLTLGYFNEADLLPSEDPAHTNDGNVLYVRAPAQMPDKDRTADVAEVAAHEFQHLIEFRIRVLDHGLPRQEVWLNEGMSFYAQLANRYFTTGDRLKIAAAANEPGWRLTSMPDTQDALLKHGRTAYGRAGLFVTYLANRFGALAIRTIIADPRTGTAAIDDALRQAHVSASQAFADWGVAALLNESGVYGYGSMSHIARCVPRLSHPVINSFPYDSDVTYVPLSMLPWSHTYFRFASRRDSTLGISVQGSPGRLRVAVVTRQKGSVVPDVDWLHADVHGLASVYLPHFGTQEADATLVIADTGPGASPDRVRVRASLVDVGDNNGVA